MGVVVVVLPKLEDAKKIQRILNQHGFSNAVACANGAAALQEINQHRYGVVISGVRLKADTVNGERYFASSGRIEYPCKGS